MLFYPQFTQNYTIYSSNLLPLLFSLMLLFYLLLSINLITLLSYLISLSIFNLYFFLAHFMHFITKSIFIYYYILKDIFCSILLYLKNKHAIYLSFKYRTKHIYNTILFVIFSCLFYFLL